MGMDLYDDIEKGEAYGSGSRVMCSRQKLYDNIIQYLTMSQKKGIIPIVQEQMSKDDPNGYQNMIKSNQKFEFDLFNLPDSTCERLETYVNDCIKVNQEPQEDPPQNNIENSAKIADQV